MVEVKKKLFNLTDCKKAKFLREMKAVPKDCFGAMDQNN